MKIHPLADLFPMMPDEELLALADDIKASGLIHAITLGKHEGCEVVVDGRNRLRACEMAGVEPEFDHLEDDADVRAFIVSANLARRNLTKGQQAMAHAMLYPEVEKGGRGKKRNSLGAEGFSQARLSQARLVYNHSHPLAELVLSGVEPLDKAVETVRREQNASEAAEAKLARLQRDAADLADHVVEGRLTVGEAEAALNERKRKHAEIVEAGKRAAASGLARFVGEVGQIVAALSLSADIELDPDMLDEAERAIAGLRSAIGEKR